MHAKPTDFVSCLVIDGPPCWIVGPPFIQRCITANLCTQQYCRIFRMIYNWLCNPSCPIILHSMSSSALHLMQYEVQYILRVIY